jgi:hypothetical protein
VTTSLEEIDSVLDRTSAVSELTPTGTLRGWRTELVQASVAVSYAIGVLSLDVEVLTHSSSSGDDDALAALVDGLPDILASGWVGGGWSLSPDASVSIAAAASTEAALEQPADLLGLHLQTVTSDLDDPDVVHDLLTRVQHEVAALTERRDHLEARIRKVQEAVLAQYGTGEASVDDWLV